MIDRALEYIPADDRETWLRVGTALKTELGEDGFATWDAWSKTSDSYSGAVMPAQWRSLRAGSIKIGTLFYLARKYGWSAGDDVMPARRRDPVAERREQEKADAERLENARKAASKARSMLEASEWSTHPYFERKGFPEHRVQVLDGEALIPVTDKHRKLLSVQRIGIGGTKKFVFGSQTAGGMLRLGRGRETYVCEGIATALSVREALKDLYRDAQVIVAFGSSNMPNVAWKKNRIVADHDLHKCGFNPCGHRWDDPELKDESGVCPACLQARIQLAAGAKYAIKTGCLWTMPPEPGDANDMHLKHGLGAVVDLMRELISRQHVERKIGRRAAYG